MTPEPGQVWLRLTRRGSVAFLALTGVELSPRGRRQVLMLRLDTGRAWSFTARGFELLDSWRREI